MTLIAKSNVLSGFLAIAWSCAPSAWAWGGQGHRTIGAIADRLMSPPARAAVAQLLSGDLDKFGRLSTRRTLEAVSDWADEITGTAAARPRWHYDDVPICGSAPKAHYCPDGQCNTGQLRRLITVLADTHAASRDRNEALKWVVHLVGDIHQPLHAADNGDRGGNRVPVALEGVRTRGRATGTLLGPACPPPPGSPSTPLPISTHWRSRRAASWRTPARGRQTAGRWNPTTWRATWRITTGDLPATRCPWGSWYWTRRISSTPRRSWASACGCPAHGSPPS